MGEHLIVPVERDIVAPTGKIVGVVRNFRAPDDGRHVSPTRGIGGGGFGGMRLTGKWKVCKYADEATHLAMMSGDPEALPYEVVLSQNTLLNTGINEFWNILAGVSGHPVFSNANSSIGIGNSSTAFSASQTGLQASSGSSNQFTQACDSGYPSISSQTITFQTTVGASNALFTWNEMIVVNSSSSIALDRVVQNQGTKSGSNVWTAQVAVTAS